MTGDHPRNTGPMLASRRCGAKTGAGNSCNSPGLDPPQRSLFLCTVAMLRQHCQQRLRDLRRLFHSGSEHVLDPSLLHCR